MAVKRKFTWSFSKYDKFNECPKMFKYIYIDKLSGLIKSDAMSIGTGLHDFLEVYSINKDLTLEKAEAIYLKSALGATSTVMPSKIKAALPLVKFYMDSGKVLTPYKDANGQYLTEKWFKLDCGNGVIVRGKTDITTIDEIVVDYKTSSEPYTQDDISDILEGKGFQLTTYCAAHVQQFRRLPKNRGFQVIVKDMSMPPQNIAPKTVLTLDHIDQCKQQYRDTDARFLKMMETGKFPRGLNPKCYWCNFRQQCRSEM